MKLKDFFIKAFCAAAIFCALNPCYAKTNEQNLTVHEIFTHPHAHGGTSKKPYGHFLHQTYHRLKHMFDLPLGDDFVIKFSGVRSGPLKREITQIVHMAPGIQTHDGRAVESHKGYGLKFSYRFD